MNGMWSSSRPKGWPRHGFQKRGGAIFFGFVAMLAVFSIDTITNDATSPLYGVGRGAQLDRIGSILDEPRGAADDTVYRPLLRAKVLAIKSHGDPLTTIRVFLALFSNVGAPQLTTSWVASYTLFLDGVLMPPLLVLAAANLLRECTQAGTYAVLEYAVSPPDHTFTFDALDVHMGFGDPGDLTVGGMMGGAVAAPA